MEKKCYEGIIALNSVQNNEQMAWYCLEKSELSRFKQLLSEGMPLTPFMLTSMVFFGYYEAEIKEVLALAEIEDSSKDLLSWVRGYFSEDELNDVLPLFDAYLPDDYPSNEVCVRLKLWNTLYRRKQCNLIAPNAPEFLLEKKTKDAYAALVQHDLEKYAPILVENRFLLTVLAASDGWKYLVDHGYAKEVLKLKDFAGLLKQNEIAEYCWKKGLINELYEAECYDVLLAHQEIDVFVKNHSTYGKFLKDYPEKVDWEDLWDTYPDLVHRVCLKEAAKLNKKVPACSEFLLAHSGLWEQIWLLCG